MSRLIIALPYYRDDMDACMTLAKFIADLEPEPRKDAEMCFVARHDAPPLPPDVYTYLSAKFPVSLFRCGGNAVGHPDGCNEMAQQFFMHGVYQKFKTGQWKKHDTIFFMEPDCVPVARDWIDQLKNERRIKTQHGLQPLVVGCYRHENVDRPHINGNALYAPDIADYVNFRKPTEGLGWDSAYFSQYGARWHRTPLIVNLWRETNVPDERMAMSPFEPNATRAPVVIHGVKDGSAWKFARKTLKLE